MPTVLAPERALSKTELSAVLHAAALLRHRADRLCDAAAENGDPRFTRLLLGASESCADHAAVLSRMAARRDSR